MWPLLFPGGGVGSSEPAEELLWENSYAEGGGCLKHKESLTDNPLQNRRPWITLNCTSNENLNIYSPPQSLVGTNTFPWRKVSDSISNAGKDFFFKLWGYNIIIVFPPLSSLWTLHLPFRALLQIHAHVHVYAYVFLNIICPVPTMWLVLCSRYDQPVGVALFPGGIYLSHSQLSHL